MPHPQVSAGSSPPDAQALLGGAGWVQPWCVWLHPGLEEPPGQPHPAVPVALQGVMLRMLIADEEIAWLDLSLAPSLSWE